MSTKGAAGLMQLMPTTAMTFGVTNRFNVQQNIRGGVAYLARLMKLFNGDLRLARKVKKLNLLDSPLVAG